MSVLKMAAVAVLLAVISSCGNSNQGDNGPYFDTKVYFTDQVDRLSGTKTGLIKTTQLGENTETDTLVSPEWNEVLSMPLQYDLNNPANYGKFSIDTSSQHPLEIYYREIGDEGLTYFVGYSEKGGIVKVSIEDNRKNILYKSAKSITFESLKGIELSGFQTIQGGTEIEYRINSVFWEP